MKKKSLIIMAISFIIVGSMLSVGTLATVYFNFNKLTMKEYQENTYEIDEKFGKISVNTSAVNVLFTTSDNEKCTVDFLEEENESFSVEVQDNELKIETNNRDKKLTDYINISFGSPCIRVYLPQKEYDALSVKTKTGKINLSNIVAKDINILSAMGDIAFDNSDADNLTVKTDTGDVSGTLLSDKTFIAKTTTGNIRVPKSDTGGKCEIETLTGDIEMEITKEDMEK